MVRRTSPCRRPDASFSSHPARTPTRHHLVARPDLRRDGAGGGRLLRAVRAQRRLRVPQGRDHHRLGRHRRWPRQDQQFFSDGQKRHLHRGHAGQLVRRRLAAQGRNAALRRHGPARHPRGAHAPRHLRVAAGDQPAVHPFFADAAERAPGPVHRPGGKRPHPRRRHPGGALPGRHVPSPPVSGPGSDGAHLAGRNRLSVGRLAPAGQPGLAAAGKGGFAETRLWRHTHSGFGSAETIPGCVAPPSGSIREYHTAMENLSASGAQGRAVLLGALRAAMADHGVDAVLIPSADPHLSEYLPGRWKGREHLSGFTGSVGTLIVTRYVAGVGTDARYWDQAAVQLAGSGIALMKIPSGASLLYIDWLAEHLQAGQAVAVDERVLGLATARLLREALQNKGVALKVDADLLDAVWHDRPSLPDAPVFEHAAPHASESRAERLALVREAMAKAGANRHFVSTLDDLAWLFNLRGADVNYNPVFLAHALIDPARATLFIGPGKIPAELAAKLAADGVDLAPYDGAAAALAALPPDSVLLVDPRRITAGMRAAVPESVKVVEAVNPSTFAKSRKSASDAAHVRATMEQDGAALCEFFAWLEAVLADGARSPLTELDIDTQICAARAPARFCEPQLRHHRGIQCQRRRHALPRHAAGACRHRRRWPAADRFGRPVPGRHHRHHPRGAGRDPVRGPEARLYFGAERCDWAVVGALPPRHPLAHARCAGPCPHLGRRHRLRPRHGPRRGLFFECARRPPVDLSHHHAGTPHGDGAGHDHFRRTGHL